MKHMNIVSRSNFSYSFSAVVALHLLVLFFFFAPSQEVRRAAMSLRLMTSTVTTFQTSESKKIVAMPIEKKITAETQMDRDSKLEEQQIQTEQSVAIPASAIISAKDEYLAGVRAAIEKKKFVPMMAKKLRQSGIVGVGFVVLADGTITNVKILANSSFSRLDQAAYDLLTSIGKHHAFPRELSHLNQMEVQVEINYDLN